MCIKVNLHCSTALNRTAEKGLNIIRLFPTCLISKNSVFLQQIFSQAFPNSYQNSPFQLFTEHWALEQALLLPHTQDVLTHLHVSLSHLLWQGVTGTLLEKETRGLFSPCTWGEVFRAMGWQYTWLQQTCCQWEHSSACHPGHVSSPLPPWPQHPQSVFPASRLFGVSRKEKFGLTPWSGLPFCQVSTSTRQRKGQEHVWSRSEDVENFFWYQLTIRFAQLGTKQMNPL